MPNQLEVPRRQGCLGMWRGGAVCRVPCACVAGGEWAGGLISDHFEGSVTRASDKQPARKAKIGQFTLNQLHQQVLVQCGKEGPRPDNGPSPNPPTTSTDGQTSYL